jgi:hypothetical protein
MSPLCAIGGQHQNSYDTDRRTRHETGLKQRDASYLTRKLQQLPEPSGHPRLTRASLRPSRL